MAEQSKSEATEELFRLATGGDEKSLEQLLTSYAGYLNFLSRAHLDRSIHHRVSPSDIVQETMLEAHRDFGNFQGSGIDQFTAWLRRVLVHNISNAIGTHVLAAKRSIRREQPLGERSISVDYVHQQRSASAIDHFRSPPSEAEYRESLAELANALEKLPCHYRTVIVLRHFEGLSFEDIAERIKRSPGATRMLWLRAIEQLRQALEKLT